MGHDLRIISQHKLDTSSLEKLAGDLSTRLHVNIDYGYFDELGCTLDGESREATKKRVVCGKIEYPGGEKTLMLDDQYHQLRQLIRRYGGRISELPYFKKDDYYQSDIREALQTDCFELYDEAEDVYYAKIYTDVFDNWYNCFYSRWWSFCRAFTEYDKEGYLLAYVTSFRKEVKSFLEKVGCAEAFYFDDQGESAQFTYDYYPWETIRAEVEANYKESTLQISDFMKQVKRRPIGDFPFVFYDDFEDLKNQQ